MAESPNTQINAIEAILSTLILMSSKQDAMNEILIKMIAKDEKYASDTLEKYRLLVSINEESLRAILLNSGGPKS